MSRRGPLRRPAVPRLPAVVRLDRFHRDANLFLATTLATGAALSLYWIDFNLYLASLGYSPATIGVVATVGSVAGAVTAFPASAISDRFGRRATLVGGIGISVVALIGLLSFSSLILIGFFAAMWAIGQQSLQVVRAPFLAEHSDPEHRNELFAVQSAVQSVTSVVAAALGGIIATSLAGVMGFDAGGPETYRIILVIMTVLMVAGLVPVAMLGGDRPATVRDRILAGAPRAGALMGIVIEDRTRFVRLLLPGFLVSIGAGQVIPFLNIFVQEKFGLDLASLNALFAFTSLGTVVALLAQPALARRFGQITSVVVVQAASIPFLAVLGFSPVLWTVIGAMVVRHSLMNASNPIFAAFAMERVTSAERATVSAAMSLLWQVGWVVGAGWYAALQATLGFDAGYAVNFVSVILLYSVATALTWVWFGATDRPVAEERGITS